MAVFGNLLTKILERPLRKFEQASAEPAASQQRVLTDLLARAADTQIGRQYGFADLRTPEQFRDRVPVTGYEQASKLWHQAFDGARDVTWPGHVRYFALSSGTTAGNKLLPVTEEAIRSNLQDGALLAAFLARRGDAASLLLGRFLYLGGTTTLRERGQSLFGDASGIMARRMPFYARARRLPSGRIAAISNWEEKIGKVVSSYLTANIGMLGACPSWAAMLFKQMRAEAEARGMAERDIGRLWPRLSHFVSYGMAFEPYRQAFDDYIGRPIHYVDTWSSSEAGMSSIQEEDGGPMRLIVDNGAYYEFVPLEDADHDNPPRLTIGQVETGRDYAVILSTNGGIWAYPLGDVVRFESLVPPRIVFAGRTQIYLSAFGEHVTLRMIEQAVSAACRRTGATVADYTVAARFPSPDQPRPAHRWIMEFDRRPDDDDLFIRTADQTIREQNEDYDTHRTDDYGMEPPILVPVAAGTFYEWMKQKGKLGSQHKVPRVARSQEMADELLKISRQLDGSPQA